VELTMRAVPAQLRIDAPSDTSCATIVTISLRDDRSQAEPALIRALQLQFPPTFAAKVRTRLHGCRASKPSH
jgi:hypothetical protein